MQKDFYGTLRRVKEMGDSGVEFAGLYGHDPLVVKNVWGSRFNNWVMSKCCSKS